MKSGYDMGRMGSFDLRELRKLQERLNRISEPEINAFLEECVKQLAAKLLAKVIRRTPTGDYPKESGKKGGTLKRGWTASQKGSGAEGLHSRSAKQYVDTLTVHQYGGYLVIEIINPVEYASYVEYGHRTANHTGWVKGRFMMTIAEQEIRQATPAMLERKIMKFFRERL